MQFLALKSLRSRSNFKKNELQFIINKFFAVSRILLRSSLRFGIISGIKKSVW